MAYRQVGYQYETSPRKLQPEYEPKKNPYVKKKNPTLKQTKNKKQEKRSIKPHVKTILYILVGFAILFSISYRNSLITEGFNRKENLKKQLNVLQKENAQTAISIQNSLNLSNIERAAADMLGMKKADEAQKVYVNLPKKDYVEPASEQVVVTEEQSWIEKLLESIMNLIG